MAGRVAGPALAVTYLSLLVLLPLAALRHRGLQRRLVGTFWTAITQPEALAALELTLAASAIVAIVNSVAGLAIACVLVRDDFRGKALLSAVDRPAVRAADRGRRSDAARALRRRTARSTSTWPGTRLGIAVALLFVTLPFCVRSVQPVLAELDAEMEEAAASLGASPRQVLRRVVLPEHPARPCWPAPASPSPAPWASSGRSC